MLCTIICTRNANANMKQSLKIEYMSVPKDGSQQQ